MPPLMTGALSPQALCFLEKVSHSFWNKVGHLLANKQQQKSLKDPNEAGKRNAAEINQSVRADEED